MRRSWLNDIHSLNWRLIFLVTVLFMGFYLLIFDDAQAPRSPPPIPTTKGNIEQDFNAQAQYDRPEPEPQPTIQIPHPVLGDKYDSPLDAVPGRVRPGGEFGTDSPVLEHVEESQPETEEDSESESNDEPMQGEEATETPTESTPQFGNGKGSQDNKSPESLEPTPINPYLQSTTTSPSWTTSVWPYQTHFVPDTVTSSTKIAVPTPVSGTGEHEEGKEKDSGHDSVQSNDGLTAEPGDFYEDYTFPDSSSSGLDENLHSTSTTASEAAETFHPSIDESGHAHDNTTKLGGEDDLSNNPLHTQKKSYVAICAALKDVPQDLPEWLIHHYHHLEIRTFYIMDDGSSPPLSTFPLPPSIPTESVIFDYQDPTQRTDGNSQQLTIYSRCIEKWGHLHTWMAFLDGDEFLELTSPSETFPQLLASFEHIPNVGALAVNWRMHTSSGLLTRPESVRAAFVECIWDGPGDGPEDHNKHVKSIVRTEFVEGPRNPHLWALKDGRVTVGEKGDVVESEAFRLPISRERIALHHYAVKSRQEYEEKMGRGNAMDDPKGEFFWDSVEHRLPKVSCPEMAQYRP